MNNSGLRAAARATCLALLVGLGACTSLLPVRQEASTSPFATFSEAKAAYDTVDVGRTSSADLVGMGYHQSQSPNIELLTYLDIIELFVPRDSVSEGTLPEGIRRCMAVQTRCTGYVVAPRRIKEAREGNAFLDFLDFKRVTHTTGWEVDAVFVLIDDVVIYKLWSGRPNIDETKTAINPLGPIQDVGTLLNRTIAQIDF